MDTKFKRFSAYNLLKAFLALIMIVSITILVPTIIYGTKSDCGRYETYEDTHDYQQKYNDLIHNIVEYYVVLKSEENIEKLDNSNEQYYESRFDRFYRIQKKLEDNVNFIYYIENPETDEVYTNIKDKNPVSFLKSQKGYAYYDAHRAENSMEINYNDDIQEMLKGTNYRVHTAIYKSLRMGDSFFTNKVRFNEMKYHFPKVKVVFVVSSIAFVLTLGALSVMVGKDGPSSYKISGVGKVYNEIQIFLALGSVIAITFFAEIIHQMGIYYSDVYGRVYDLHSGLYLAVFILLGLSFLSQIKNRVLLKNTLIYRILKGAFSTKLLLGVCLFLALFLGGNGILMIFIITGLSSSPSFGLLISIACFIAFNLGIIHFVQKSLSSLWKIISATKEYAKGNYEKTYPLEDISITFRDFYKDILSIKNSMEGAIREAVKGERLKTELITNVSHDLKTPLTSIINYVDLLKREGVNSEKSLEYIDILDEKSSRLKQLVEDLLEASKASSGNVQVDIQELDLNELLQQAIGEYEDKFTSSDLDLIANTTEEAIIVKGDSKHLWRIMENLFSNVLKYSMKGTRVYCYTEAKDGFGIITIKNISAEALDITPEELTQRFVRGDTSRTTEGSGLGLSIVESLAKVQGGEFRINIDGDLFKVEVLMPIAE